jgi:hypothetical protein
LSIEREPELGALHVIDNCVASTVLPCGVDTYPGGVDPRVVGTTFFSDTIDDPVRPDNFPLAVKVYGPFPAQAQMMVDAPDASANV